ncbi:MAG: hypothetical protein EOM17_14310 [Synergistales bacterium]|nr:hypothetical protein [Synergistales bacterium]
MPKKREKVESRLNDDILLQWYTASDGVEVVPEGYVRQGEPTTLQDGKVIFRDSLKYVSRSGFRVNEARKIIIPKGAESEQRIIRKDDAPRLIADLLEARTTEDAVRLTEKYGPLREWSGIDCHERVISCDSVADWLDLSFTVDCALNLHRSIVEKDSSRFIETMGGDRFFIFRRDDTHMLPVPVMPWKGESDQLLARRALAHLLQSNMIRDASFRTMYSVLPSGQIGAFPEAVDLISLIWKIVESVEPSVLSTPPISDYSLHRCRYCHVWDLRDGHESDPVPEPMCQDRKTGEYYHERCKRNEVDEQRRIEKAAREGREYKVRMGSKKPGPTWYRERAR